MTDSPSVDRAPKRRLPSVLARIMLATACLSFTTAPSFAEKRGAPVVKAVAQTKPLWPQMRKKVRVSGSAYVCMPSGFGQKGRCVQRASML